MQSDNVREAWETLLMEAAEITRNLDCKGGVKEAFTKVILVVSIENT